MDSEIRTHIKEPTMSVSKFTLAATRRVLRKRTLRSSFIRRLIKSGIVYAAMRHRVPDSCIQLAQVTATLGQLPGPRPMAHELGPTRYIARGWPRPGAILARLQSDPSVKRASHALHLATPTPVNMERAFGTPLTTLSCAELLFTLNPKYLKKFCSWLVEIFFTADKKAPLERGIGPQPDICRDEWVQVGMALKPEVKRLERGTS
jgi:hypothetical protein